MFKLIALTRCSYVYAVAYVVFMASRRLRTQLLIFFGKAQYERGRCAHMRNAKSWQKKATRQQHNSKLSSTFASWSKFLICLDLVSCSSAGCYWLHFSLDGTLALLFSVWCFEECSGEARTCWVPRFPELWLKAKSWNLEFSGYVNLLSTSAKSLE